MTTATGATQFLGAVRPEFISDRDYQQRIEIATTIRNVNAREKKIEEGEQVLGRDKLETESLKRRVIRQLAIIDAFTSDPGTLETIEDYDDAFAPRNLANLKRLGELRAKATQG